MTELKDTVNLMLSDKFEDRLKAEYVQLSIRLSGLCRFIESEKFSKLSITQKELMKAQFQFMSTYQYILSERMKDLKIDIPQDKNP